MTKYVLQRSLAEQAASNLDRSRVHGNGFLIIDVDPDTRLHLWGHPDLPRQTVPSMIHNHRFGFMSKVLWGRLVNVFYTDPKPERPDGGAQYVDVYQAQDREGEDTQLVKVADRRYVSVRSTTLVLAGEIYDVTPWEFHETFISAPTITLMKKTTVNCGAPSVLTDHGTVPDNEFSKHQLTLATRERVFWDMMRRWEDHEPMP